MQTGDEADDKLDETLILDVLAGGGKVCAARLCCFCYFLFLFKFLIGMKMRLPFTFCFTKFDSEVETSS